MATPKQLTTGIMLAMLVWGLWLATGAAGHNRGVIKSLIIAGCVAAFLGVWLLLLRSRAKRT